MRTKTDGSGTFVNCINDHVYFNDSTANHSYVVIFLLTPVVTWTVLETASSLQIPPQAQRVKAQSKHSQLKQGNHQNVRIYTTLFAQVMTVFQFLGSFGTDFLLILQ